jgi:DNA-binding NarL/FixJ family response regulator
MKGSTESGSRNMKILLVEDSLLLRTTIKEILSEYPDLEVAGEAGGAPEAISLLEKMQFDMIVSDISLTMGNGFDVIRYALSPDYAHPKPVCMIVTNYTDARYLDRSTDLGVKYFYDKSMDFGLAIEAIEAEAKEFKETNRKNGLPKTE